MENKGSIVTTSLENLVVNIWVAEYYEKYVTRSRPFIVAEDVQRIRGKYSHLVGKNDDAN